MTRDGTKAPMSILRQSPDKIAKFARTFSLARAFSLRHSKVELLRLLAKQSDIEELRAAR